MFTNEVTFCSAVAAEKQFFIKNDESSCSTGPVPRSFLSALQNKQPCLQSILVCTVFIRFLFPTFYVTLIFCVFTLRVSVPAGSPRARPAGLLRDERFITAVCSFLHFLSLPSSSCPYRCVSLVSSPLCICLSVYLWVACVIPLGLFLQTSSRLTKISFLFLGLKLFFLSHVCLLPRRVGRSDTKV